ncbi:MAG: type II toxin-antitoxin system ParD family antitoxin [Thiotrichales bacterium]
MATLNISLPDQLRDWVSEQVRSGQYASASDYLRDLIRNDQRERTQGWEWLSSHLEPLLETPVDQFVALGPDEVKARARHAMNAKA